MQGIIKTLRTNEFAKNKTLTLVFYELTEGGTRYAERTYNIVILQNDTYGQLSFTSTNWKMKIIKFNLQTIETPGMPFATSLKLESFLGVYGTDYVITNATFIDEINNLFYVNFDGVKQKPIFKC